MPQLITVIGRGHGGTRAMSHTLAQSGVYMGAQNNSSGDLVPADDMYAAARLFAEYVDWVGGLEWDFSRALAAQPPSGFCVLIEAFLSSVLQSDARRKGWKLPETTLVYPWIVRMFPDAYYIEWIRDPRDSILGAHLTDDLNNWGVGYPPTDDIRERRAISWKYQREIIAATPKPRNLIQVRFEDFVLDQDETLKRLEDFLGFDLVKIPVKPDPVGRYRSDGGRHMFEFFAPDLAEHGYLEDEQTWQR